MKKRCKTKRSKREQIAQTLVATANIFRVSVRTISTWKAEGRMEAGFLPDGTVSIKALRAWRKQRQGRRSENTELDARILFQKLRRIKWQNDRTEESLISREFMRNASEKAIAEIKSKVDGLIERHVALFPATGPADIASNRAILREIWDHILERMQELSDEFKAPIPE